MFFDLFFICFTMFLGSCEMVLVIEQDLNDVYVAFEHCYRERRAAPLFGLQ